MSQRQPVSLAEIGLLICAAFAIVGRNLSLRSAPHNVVLAVALIVALAVCVLWRRGEALGRPGGAVFLVSVVAWLIWLGARDRLSEGALGVPGWPPSIVMLAGWATVIAWLGARVLRRGGGEPGRGFWVVGAGMATGVVVVLALLMFLGMRRAGAAPAVRDLVELLDWALLYGALFTVAMHQFVGARARRDAVVLAVILVIVLSPIGGLL